MKKFIKYIAYSILCAGMLVPTSCNEDEFLKEVPLDFYSPENSYVNYDNFQSALTELYARVRSINYSYSEITHHIHNLGTDVAKDARHQSNRRLSNYNDVFKPTDSHIRYHWDEWFKVVANANTVLSRLEDSEMTDAQKSEVKAEALFFRGFAYRYLGILFGGVPITTEEVTSPQSDFVRASQDEVYNQVISDLKAAADALPGISEVKDGKVSNLVASYYLAETYITKGQYSDAITAVSKVIDDPNTALMTERFGTRSGEPGDVYWDLFRRGNQNRSGGNTEAIWVAQMEIDVPGGFLTTTEGVRNGLERMCAPAIWSCTTPDGQGNGFIRMRSTYNQGGRGVSFMANTDWYIYDIWGDDFDNDMRNSQYNFQRTGVFDNPDSEWFGKPVNDPDNPSQNWKDQKWRWYPFPIKVTTVGNHPDAIYLDPALLTLKSNAGSTFRDMYYLRLAECYLLRAEAYHLNNENGKAATDINTVRNRVNATPIVAADVDIDYILDERARELVYEEQRRLTLVRTGKLIERVKKYNKLNADNIEEHHKLFPIPFSDIEANEDAELTQNPGYTN